MPRLGAAKMWVVTHHISRSALFECTAGPGGCLQVRQRGLADQRVDAICGGMRQSGKVADFGLTGFDRGGTASATAFTPSIRSPLIRLRSARSSG